MKILTLVVGPIQTNCYIAFDEISKEAFVIDVGGRPQDIMSIVKENALSVKGIIATHGHFDHVTAVIALNKSLDVPFYIHEADVPMVPPQLVEALSPGQLLSDGKELKIAGMTFKVIHTPGHTHGGICLYCEKDKVLFSGDTLFYADHGRCDLPVSDYGRMVSSLKKLFLLPDDTVVYPGHGGATTIGAEKTRGLI